MLPSMSARSVISKRRMRRPDRHDAPLEARDHPPANRLSASVDPAAAHAADRSSGGRPGWLHEINSTCARGCGRHRYEAREPEPPGDR